MAVNDQPRQKVPAIGLAIALAVAAVAPFTTGFEGEKHKAYLDPVKIPTYCVGDTENVVWGKVYSHEECQGLLRNRLAKDYAPAVLKCVPGLADPKRLKVFEASLDAAYNAGTKAFCRSPMARRFNAGQWDSGCAAFVGWYDTAKGRRLPGLVNRRHQEAALCLEGV